VSTGAVLDLRPAFRGGLDSPISTADRWVPGGIAVTGSRSWVVALAAVGGCFLAFWAPANAQGPTSPVEGAAPAGPEAGPLDPGEESPAESDTGPALQARGSKPVSPAGSASDLNRIAAAVRLAWRTEAEDPVGRARRARRAALQHGMWNFDPAARVLIGPELSGAGFERAQAAVALSPPEWPWPGRPGWRAIHRSPRCGRRSARCSQSRAISKRRSGFRRRPSTSVRWP